MAIVKMLCRVLFVAAVVSYVLCVLLLGGVQKEELAAGTLRKLRQHNVNIGAIGDRKLRSQCLAENNLTSTLSTRPVHTDDEAKTTTMKPTIFETETQSASSPSQWNKLLAYFKQKQQNSTNLKETTMLSPTRNRFLEDIIGKVTRTPEIIVENYDTEKTRYALHNSDQSQPESTTAKVIAERSNDVEYISKIVAEILSQRQTKPVEAPTVPPVRTFSANKLIEHIDKVLEENKRNEVSFRSNNSSDNLAVTENQDNSHEEPRGNKKEKEVIEALLNQLRYRDIEAISNLKNSFLNDIQTEMGKGKITLYNARDKLSDMQSIAKNEPNNWLYVDDGHGIKPTSEPLTDRKEEVFNQLSERDKAFLCKSNNGIHLIQKEIYSYICPHSDSSKLRASPPEEQNNLHFDSPNDRDKTSKYVNENYHYPNDNKSIWPYFFENQNNAKDQKFEMEQNNLDIKLPSNHYESMKTRDLSEDNEYKNKWPHNLERLRNAEQQDLNRENINLLLNQLNNREKITYGIDEVNRDKTKALEKPLYPLGFANHPNGDNYYNTEWAFNIQSANEFEHKLENKQENPIFIPPKADKKVINPNYPRLNGEFKNDWPYYVEDDRITQNPNSKNKNSLYQIPPDREMLSNNHERMVLNKESSINSRVGEREITSNSRDINNPKSFNWYEMKDKKSSGTLGYNVRDEQKSSIRDETSNTKNNISPNNYETINWPYFIERQKTQHDLITREEMKKEPLHNTNSKFFKHNEYDLAQKDEAYKKFLMNAEARSDLPQNSKKEENEKIQSLPPDVLKEIADKVKQIVLKDLKTATPVTSTTETTITTTTAKPITTTTIEAITTTTSIITSSTTVPITVETKAEPKTTTDTPSTTAKEDDTNIQEASQALKTFMELFEKFNQMNSNILNPNITKTRDNITQTQRAIVIATVPTMIRNPYASFKMATVPALVRNNYAPYKFYAPLLPPMSPYGISPFLQTKAMVLDPYLQKIIQIPDTVHNNAVDNAPSVGQSKALTFQTNSNEIKPLKVPVSKAMIVENIVVSPKPPRDRGRHLREYRDESYRYGKSNRYAQRNEYNKRPNRSRDYLKFENKSKPRSMKKDYNDRYYKTPPNYDGVRFHEKLEKEDSWPKSTAEVKCGSKEICNERVAPRQQRPLINIASTYDDTHFRNFLKTQQKVNDMLERILATKTKQSRRSSEVI